MSAIFPATYSTLCPKALGELVSQQYGFKVSCQLIIIGVGDTYLVEGDTDRYILRVYRNDQRNELQILEELDFLLALKAADVPVSFPLADLTSNVLQTVDAVEGKRHAVLFSYAPGRSLDILNNEQLRNLGRQMARMHNVSAGITHETARWTFDIDTVLSDPLEILRPAFEDIPEDYEWLQKATQQVKERIDRTDTSAFSWGYCHYDMLQKNFHFEDDSVTFFDFDFLGTGWLVNDIMTFWVQLCLDVHFGRITQEAADNAYAIFLDGYREHRALSNDELAIVPYLSLGFWLFYSGFHTTHDQFYIFTRPVHLKARFGWVRCMTEKYWIK